MTLKLFQDPQAVIDCPRLRGRSRFGAAKARDTYLPELRPTRIAAAKKATTAAARPRTATAFAQRGRPLHHPAGA